MKTVRQCRLDQYTSLGCGGVAEELVEVANSGELLELLGCENADQPITVLGYGCNSLLSDTGIPGLVVVTHGGALSVGDDGTTITADAGVWWDDLVVKSIELGLWGLECLTGVPGGVGAAVVGNIACYGQAVSDTLVSIDAFDRTQGKKITLEADELELAYRSSVFKTPEYANIIILSATFQLTRERKKELSYESALAYAREHDLPYGTPIEVRELLLQVREQAGSLYDYRHPNDQLRTAGSFFKNPEVSQEKAEFLRSFDETHRTLESLKLSSQAHSGSTNRVSAAHVLLAAGFHRGQEFGRVRLHPSSVLKLENMGGATAAEIAEVSRHIVDTVKEKLDIDLECEVKFIGDF